MCISIIFQEIIVADPFPYILDRRIGRHARKHLHIPFKLIDPVHHPVFVTVEIPHLFKRNLVSRQAVATNVPLRPVHHRKKITAVPLPFREPEVSLDILCDEMVVQVRKVLPHLKRDVALDQLLGKRADVSVNTEQHGDLLRRHAFFHPLFDLIRDILRLFVGVF